jgi:RHS repeat-associated protein
VHSRQGYYPYGETRYAAGTLPTDFGFTGQRNDATIGLYDYHARWYDPALGRFISADTLVPEPVNPQDFNRYAYVRNNPLRYTDPTGHMDDWGAMEGGGTAPPPPQPPPFPYDITSFELGWLWLTEQCPEYIVFDENYELTQSLMHDEGVNLARAQFYQRLQEGALANGIDDTYPHEYKIIPYVREAAQYLVGYDRVGFFLGSYTVRTHLNDDGTVTFAIEDPKNLESGTRMPWYWVPDFITEVGQRFDSSFELPRSRHSFEGLVMGSEQFDFPQDIFLASILKARSRSDPGLFGSNIRVGGSIRLAFTWTEPLQVDQER